jgi:hypothetical protein
VQPPLELDGSCEKARMLETTMRIWAWTEGVEYGTAGTNITAKANDTAIASLATTFNANAMDQELAFPPKSECAAKNHACLLRSRQTLA